MALMIHPPEGGLAPEPQHRLQERAAASHERALPAAPSLELFRELAAHAPLVVDVFADRPAILEPVAEVAAAVTVNWGASAEALLDVLSGRFAPQGRLPFDLPRSMAAVEASRPDIPFDTADPLFRFGHGLTYAS